MSFPYGTELRSEAAKVYTVTEITREIKASFEREFPDEVCVQGELFNVRPHASGHCYFTLKDERAQLSAVWFQGRQHPLDFEFKDGVAVRVWGEVRVYESRGVYQIYVRRVERYGLGELYRRLEELKKKLREEGLFDRPKKHLPALPRRIGIVTSPTGAALRDMLRTLRDGFPNVHVVLAPARVQGEEAAREIAEAIKDLGEWGCGRLDVIIVGRGGGSFEDLWCFNEEQVARAIAESRIPVISAVGHETDHPISDDVADIRAATPTAAAKLIVRRKQECEEQIRARRDELRRAADMFVQRLRREVLEIARSDVFRGPDRVVKVWRQRLAEILARMTHRIKDSALGQRQEMDRLLSEMEHRLAQRCEAFRHELRRLGSQMEALNPVAVLCRGYSITTDVAGRVVKSVRAVRIGESVITRVADGQFVSAVSAKEAGALRTKQERTR